MSPSVQLTPTSESVQPTPTLTSVCQCNWLHPLSQYNLTPTLTSVSVSATDSHLWVSTTDSHLWVSTTDSHLWVSTTDFLLTKSPLCSTGANCGSDSGLSASQILLKLFCSSLLFSLLCDMKSIWKENGGRIGSRVQQMQDCEGWRITYMERLNDHETHPWGMFAGSFRFPFGHGKPILLPPPPPPPHPYTSFLSTPFSPTYIYHSPENWTTEGAGFLMKQN